jgi:hypothetical protein
MDWREVFSRQLKFNGLGSKELEEYSVLLKREKHRAVEQKEPYRVHELSRLTGISEELWRGFQK